VRTVRRIGLRHNGQLVRLIEHRGQQTKCPQGRNTIPISLSIHILHNIFPRFSVDGSIEDLASDRVELNNLCNSSFDANPLCFSIIYRFRDILTTSKGTSLER
jgi:hypothetical protein